MNCESCNCSPNEYQVGAKIQRFLSFLEKYADELKREQHEAQNTDRNVRFIYELDLIHNVTDQFCLIFEEII